MHPGDKILSSRSKSMHMSSPQSLDGPDGPCKEGKLVQEEWEVLGLGAGVRKVCGATGGKKGREGNRPT